MAEGLFIIRAVLGLLLIGHGCQKLFGWFDGHGLDGTGGFFESVGHRPGRAMAALAGLSEAGGGLSLLFGFLTPLGAAAVIGVMTVAAISVHAPNGLWVTNGGYELPLTNALIAAGLAFTGAGSFSVDHALGWGLSGLGAGIGAVVLGLIGASIQLARRQQPAEQQRDDAYPAEEAPAGDRAGADAEATGA
jgi:putative oxidoreductase